MAKRVTKKSQGLFSMLFSSVNNLQNNAESRARVRKALALLLILFCIFAFIAFLSYFFTGSSDQSVVESGGEFAAESRNWLGFLGAKIAELLVNQGFGVVSFVLPLYGALYGLAILETDFYQYLARLFKYVFFLLFWGATSFGYIEYLNGISADSVYLGGGIGYVMVTFLLTHIGTIGTPLLIFALLIIFIILTGHGTWLWEMLFGAWEGINQGVSASAKVVKATAKQAPAVAKQGSLFSLIKEKVSKFNPLQDMEEAEEIEEKLASSEENTALRNTPTNKKATLPPPPKVPETEKPIVVDLSARKRFNLPPTPAPKVGENGQLELQIEEGDLELQIETPSNPNIVSREKLGEDNVERVITADGEEYVEKIMNEEDEELENPDSLIDWDLYDPTKDLSGYEKPRLELLDDHGTGRNREINRQELEENKNKIVKALRDFGIEIQSIKATVGPTVTLYEIVPSPGVRISKIRNLEDDIALNLAALGIRIIAPMPGKGTIGIEIPNSNPEVVSLRSVLSTEKYLVSKAELPIVLGRTISNEVYIVDLNKLPHLLMAGSTGQGKSVGINTIISSLLFCKHPAEVKFVLIDPKKVELNLYQPLLNHFLAVLPDQTEPTITDAKDAVLVLKSLCIEMDNRYSMLKAAKVRNLKEYNDKFFQKRLNPHKGHKFLPYIVLIIDELADLMMVAGKEVEMPIARLAQLARAVGIHLVVATQRPSVNVITGIIKANFPARLSYRVISKVDSRTILDANGADQLIGRGDMLLSTGNDLIRVQNAFIDTPEVERLVEFIAKQRGYPEPYFLPEAPEENAPEEEDIDGGGDRDAMFQEAARVVVRYQLGSASLIQRKLKLGYARAGRIIDQLERAGIVGQHSGSKARDVLVPDEASLEKYFFNV